MERNRLTGIEAHEVSPFFHPLLEFWEDVDAMVKNSEKTPV